MDDPTKDTIPRSAVEYCLRKETVSTNPEKYKTHEKFIDYMNDPDISEFGHWMHSNGFNCALTTISVDLKKIPSVTPSAQPGCEDAVSRADVDILIEEAQTAWLRGDIMLMYPALKKGLQKVPSVTPKQPKWTYIEEELPETIINKHTHDFQEYNCLCDFGDYGFDVRTYKYGNGHFWNGGGNVDKYVIAWQSLPEIPDALKPEPWEEEKAEGAATP